MHMNRPPLYNKKEKQIKRLLESKIIYWDDSYLFEIKILLSKVESKHAWYFLIKGGGQLIIENYGIQIYTSINFTNQVIANSVK